MFLHTGPTMDDSVPCLLPPWSKVCTEVSLSPRREGDNVVVNIAVCKSKGEWGWSTHHLTLVVILRSMAWAHELVFGWIPWHHTSQVGAHGIESILLDLTISGDNQVGGITLESLSQAAVSWLMGLEPFGSLSTTHMACHHASIYERFSTDTIR